MLTRFPKTKTTTHSINYIYAAEYLLNDKQANIIKKLVQSELYLLY